MITNCVWEGQMSMYDIWIYSVMGNNAGGPHSRSTQQTVEL